MHQRTIRGSSQTVPAIGQGTGYGNFLARTVSYGEEHVDAFRYAIDLGMTFIDTAEEYGTGEAERAVAKAIRGRRDQVFIATKVSSEHLRYNDVIEAAEASLRRLEIDQIDLYQLHWPNPRVPLEETMRAMAKLLEQGKIRYAGLCNSSLRQLKQAETLLPPNRLAAAQVEYNLVDRTSAEEVSPFCGEKGIMVIAYSPLVQGRVAGSAAKFQRLTEIAGLYEKTPAQLALNWLIAHQSVVAIPFSASRRHIEQNASAGEFAIAQEHLSEIEDSLAPRPISIATDRIRVTADTGSESKVYRTLEEATRNLLGMVPSPVELAEDILRGDVLKPVKVAPTGDGSGKYDYDLVEGRLRYWAWVIAHHGQKPVPALVRE